MCIAALDEVEDFLQRNPFVQAYLVDVRAQRALSLGIAERSGVRHESPQLIVFQRGLPTWNASHGDVTAHEIERHLPRG